MTLVADTLLRLIRLYLIYLGICILSAVVVFAVYETVALFDYLTADFREDDWYFLLVGVPGFVVGLYISFLALHGGFEGSIITKMLAYGGVIFAFVFIIPLFLFRSSFVFDMIPAGHPVLKILIIGISVGEGLMIAGTLALEYLGASISRSISASRTHRRVDQTEKKSEDDRRPVL